MSDMTHGDWFEEGSFEDALAHFDAQASELTTGPLPGGLSVITVPPTISAASSMDRLEAPEAAVRSAALKKLVSQH